MAKLTKRLPFATELERAACHLLLTDRTFFKRIGKDITPENLGDEHAQRVLECARAFYAEVPAGTFSLTVLAQRLRRMRERGKLLHEEGADTFDWAEILLSEEAPDRDSVIGEVAVEVRRALNQQAITLAMDKHAKHDKLTEVADLIREADRLGEDEEAHTAAWDDEADSKVYVPPPSKKRLPTGIEGLDEALDGGVERGLMTFALGSTGAGKSMYLTQQAAEAMLAGENPLIVSLEVDENLWLARLRAASSGIPIKAIRTGDLTEQDRAQLREARRGRVAYIVKLRSATMEDIWHLFDEANAERKKQGAQPFTVLIVDYADKCSYPAHLKGPYEGMKHVYELLRNGGLARDVWTYTASAATRKDRARAKNRLLTSDDCADSLHKPRAADVLITLNISTDRQTMRVFLEKQRGGEGGFVSDYLETDYAYGRIVKSATRVQEKEEAVDYADSAMELPFR